MLSMRNKTKIEDLIVRCDCGTLEHAVRFTGDADDAQWFNMEWGFAEASLLDRIKTAWRIFVYGSTNAVADIVLRPADLEAIHEWTEQWLKEIAAAGKGT